MTFRCMPAFQTLGGGDCGASWVSVLLLCNSVAAIPQCHKFILFRAFLSRRSQQFVFSRQFSNRLSDTKLVDASKWFQSKELRKFIINSEAFFCRNIQVIEFNSNLKKKKGEKFKDRNFQLEKNSNKQIK